MASNFCLLITLRYVYAYLHKNMRNCVIFPIIYIFFQISASKQTRGFLFTTQFSDRHRETVNIPGWVQLGVQKEHSYLELYLQVNLITESQLVRKSFRVRVAGESESTFTFAGPFTWHCAQNCPTFRSLFTPSKQKPIAFLKQFVSLV